MIIKYYFVIVLVNLGILWEGECLFFVLCYCKVCIINFLVDIYLLVLGRMYFDNVLFGVCFV